LAGGWGSDCCDCFAGSTLDPVQSRGTQEAARAANVKSESRIARRMGKFRWGKNGRIE
jgi:hypothetical protein